MQMTSHGIPCNLPVGYRPKPKVQVVKKSRIIDKPMQIVELTRYVDGLEESMHVPLNTKEHKQALAEGFKFVRAFERKRANRKA